LLALAVMA
jgi:hypothetical protein